MRRSSQFQMMAGSLLCSDFAAPHHHLCMRRTYSTSISRVFGGSRTCIFSGHVHVSKPTVRAFREWHSYCNNQTRPTCDTKHVGASPASASEPRRAADDQGFYQCGSFGKTSSSASGTGKKSTTWGAYFVVAPISSRNGSIASRTRCATATCIRDRKHSLVVRPRRGNQERAGEPAECRSDPYPAVLHGKLFTGKHVHQLS